MEISASTDIEGSVTVRYFLAEDLEEELEYEVVFYSPLLGSGEASYGNIDQQWSACGGFEDVCDGEGRRTRRVAKMICADDLCGIEMIDEEEVCTREVLQTEC